MIRMYRVGLAPDGEHIVWEPPLPRLVGEEDCLHILLEFSRLEDAPADRIMRFARSYGPLPICVHGRITAYHGCCALPEAQPDQVPDGLKHLARLCKFYVAPVESWRRYARFAKAWIDVFIRGSQERSAWRDLMTVDGRDVNARKTIRCGLPHFECFSPPGEGLSFLFPPAWKEACAFYGCKPEVGVEGAGEEVPSLPTIPILSNGLEALGRDEEARREAAIRWQACALDRMMQYGDVRIVPRVSGGEISLTVGYKGLVGALAVGMLGSRCVYICSYCGKPFALPEGRKKPQSGRNVYCPTCGEKARYKMRCRKNAKAQR
jgi:DNA-directed RNA polymerase subunit RPC12/RpoP